MSTGFLFLTLAIIGRTLAIPKQGNRRATLTKEEMMMSAPKVEIPRIDPNVQYIGVSKLRTFNATNLGKLDKTLVIQDNDKPLVVMLRYEQFLEMQQEMDRVVATLQTVLSKGEREPLLSALQEAADGDIESIDSIRKNLKKGSE